MHQLAPIVALLKHYAELRQGFIVARNVRLVASGHKQYDRAFNEFKAEYVRIIGGRRHFAIEIIHVAAYSIYVKIAEFAPFQKRGLIRLPVALVKVYRVLYIQPLSFKRYCRAHNVSHFGFQLQYVLLAERGLLIYCYIQPRPERIPYAYPRRREQPPYRRNKYELQRAFVYPSACFFLIAKQMYVHVLERRISKAEYLAAYLRRKRARRKRHHVKIQLFHRVKQALPVLYFAHH